MNADNSKYALVKAPFSEEPFAMTVYEFTKRRIRGEKIELLSKVVEARSAHAAEVEIAKLQRSGEEYGAW